MKPLLRLVLLAALLAAVPQAPALLITPDMRLFTTSDNEEVRVTFVGATAARTNLLWEHSPDSLFLFNEDTAAVGDTVSLGTFAAGTEIIFRLDTYENGDLWHVWFTGPGTRNVDGIIHAAFVPWTIPGVWVMGFEDYHLLDPRFDNDYNDTVVLVYSQVIPEPATLALVGMGLAIGGRAIRRRRRG